VKLVQILLPLRDNRGRAFQRALYERVQKEITKEFGGVTAYTRSPARGVWNTAGKAQLDDVIMIEVMSRRPRRAWWKRYRRELERRFRQDHVIVRMQEMLLL
jgi:hypothetical protein